MIGKSDAHDVKNYATPLFGWWVCGMQDLRVPQLCSDWRSSTENGQRRPGAIYYNRLEFQTLQYSLVSVNLYRTYCLSSFILFASVGPSLPRAVWYPPTPARSSALKIQRVLCNPGFITQKPMQPLCIFHILYINLVSFLVLNS